MSKISIFLCAIFVLSSCTISHAPSQTLSGELTPTTSSFSQAASLVSSGAETASGSQETDQVEKEFSQDLNSLLHLIDQEANEK